MKIAAIVVTYNRKNMLQECIQHLLAQKDASCDVLLIDNASTDGTREYVDDLIDGVKVQYFNTGANLGGAGGFQWGIKKAYELGYDYFWLMDDDCMPTDTALKEFLLADKRLGGKYGFLSSKVLWKDNSICTMNVQRRTLTRNVEAFGDYVIPVAMASFVSLFIPAEIVKEVGLPIKEFFIWTDDWEYTRRISRKHKCYLITSSVVVHKSKVNIGANISNDTVDRLDRYMYLYRNDVYLYRREGLRGFAYECVRLPSHALRVVLKAPDNKLKRIKYIVQGTMDGFKFKPEIEYAEKK